MTTKQTIINGRTIEYHDLSPTHVFLICKFDQFVEGATGTRKFNQLISEHFAPRQAIQIYEDEWNNKQDIVASKIQSLCKFNDQQRIYARKCKIVNIVAKQKTAFLDANHIQGRDNSGKYYGLEYEGKLVAVITFAKPRLAMNGGGNDPRSWELCRFATDINYHVIGAASKLLAHFKKNNDWSYIYSFADRRFSVGNLYQTIGFEQVSTTAPSYFYIVDGAKKHRFSFRKDQLPKLLEKFDINLTEYENMMVNGIDRVWDCGCIKFMMVNEEDKNGKDNDMGASLSDEQIQSGIPRTTGIESCRIV